jgi:hypothetical protein
VVEGARLESVYTGNRIVGSNPTLTATHRTTRSVVRNVVAVLGVTPAIHAVEAEVAGTASGGHRTSLARVGRFQHSEPLLP